MKNILKYSMVALLAIFAMGCQEFEDHTEVVDGVDGVAFIYVVGQSDAVVSATLSHTPIGPLCSLTQNVQIKSNTIVKANAAVTLKYDATYVEKYNEDNHTEYAVLPAEYIKVENPTLTFPGGSAIASDFINIAIDTDQDLSVLKEPYYLAPFVLESNSVTPSEDKKFVWVVIKTEESVLRPISSSEELVGFKESLDNRASWKVIDHDDYSALFEDYGAPRITESPLVIDLSKEYIITALDLYSYLLDDVFFEYSNDNQNWKQIGGLRPGYYISGSSNWSAGDCYFAFYGFIKARYIKIDHLTYSSSAYYQGLNRFNIYYLDSENPQVFTECGDNNEFSGAIKHVVGGETAGKLDASFGAKITIAQKNPVQVSAKYDASLVAAYNTANGTSYEALPAANYALDRDNITIAAGAVKSEDKFNVSLTGDMSGLTNENGYLLPLRLDAGSTEVNPDKSIVYVKLSVATSYYKPISSAEEMNGIINENKDNALGFTVIDAPNSTGDTTKVFDGDIWSEAINFTGWEAFYYATIDMQSSRAVKGIRVYGFKLSTIQVEFSDDNATWNSMGTAEEDDMFQDHSGSYSGGYSYVTWGSAQNARYVRLTFGYYGYYKRFREFNIYE